MEWAISHIGLVLTAAGVVVTLLALCWQVYTWRRKNLVKLLVIQRGSDITNTVFTTDGDGTGYVAEVCIVNDSMVPTLIRGFDLEIPWNDPYFDWCADPIDANHRKGYYTVTGTQIDYPREMVIDHCTYDKGKLSVGGAIEGMLLGWGTAPIPKDFPHNTELKMKLTVFDHNAKGHSEHFRFRVDTRRRRIP